MSVTTTAADTLKDELNKADPNKIADALQEVALGDMMTVQKDTISQTAATTVDLTATTSLARAALMIQSVRVTGGAAAHAMRQIGDASATPSSTVCALSDDGTTLTFEDTVSGAVIVWIPRPKTATTAAFKRQ